MIKAISLLAIAAFFAMAIFVIPGFAPRLEASEPPALRKSDKAPLATDCPNQTWPNIASACLRRAGSPIAQARVVGVERR